MLSSVTWRWYRDELALPSTAYDIEAGVQLAASSDDAEWVYVDNVPIGSNGVYNDIVYYPITPQPGTTMLDFVVRNNQGGSSTGNPTGLAYKTTVNYSTPSVSFAESALTFQLIGAGGAVVTTNPQITVLLNGEEATPAFADGVYDLSGLVTANGDYTVEVYDGCLTTLLLGSKIYHVDPVPTVERGRHVRG